MVPPLTPVLDAIMNPSAALKATAEDFLESLAQTPGRAQAELINLVLRACGCNDSVDADEVVDYDGVVDALDNFTEGLKKVRASLPLRTYIKLIENRTIPQFTPSRPNCQYSRSSENPSPSFSKGLLMAPLRLACFTLPISCRLFKPGWSPCLPHKYAVSDIQQR